jgi:RNA polymerase sigma factor (sigma-70 family)
MSSSALVAGVRHLRVAASARRVRDESDEQLLRAFTDRRDDTAFAALVRRYGPMVLQVCCRVLGHQQDAEDAFQATFLVLAQSAAALRQTAALAGFLHGTAYRMALAARRAAARRRKHEGRAPARPCAGPSSELLWREVRMLLDEEIARLPAIYRSVFVACCLEGASREEAARRLGLKEGTLSSRLAEARKRLARRLARRGVELSAVLGALAVAAELSPALTAELVGTTVNAAGVVAAGAGTAGLVPAPVAHLLQSVAPAGMVSKTWIAAVLLLAASVMAGTGVWMAQSSDTPPAAAQPAAKEEGKKARPRTSPSAKDRTVAVSGRVLDPDAKPMAGAKIYYCLPHPGREAGEVRATSDADGRFRFELPRPSLDKLEQDTPWGRLMVAAVAPGYGPAWTTFSAPGEAAGLQLRLVKDDVPIDARILDLEGRPIAGVTVRAYAIDASGERLSLSVPALPHTETTTDARGRFRLTGVGRDRDLEISLRGPTIATRVGDVFVRTRVSPPAHRLLNKQLPDLGKISYYGATSDIVAGPTKPVVGVVTDKDTGKPLPGVRVQSQFLATHGLLVEDFIQTTTDREGRYRLIGLPKGKGNRIAAIAPAGQPYFVAHKEVPDTLGLDAVRVDFALKRGVWIRGRVADMATGKAVRAHVRYGAFLDNPHLRGVPGYEGSQPVETTADGSFTVLGLPGRGLLAVKAEEDRYLPATGADQVKPADKMATNFEWMQTDPLFVTAEYHAFAPVQPHEDDRETTCAILLDPGKTVRGTVVGPDGKPLEGVRVLDLKLMWSNPGPLTSAHFTATALDPRQPRRLYFQHREKRLGAAVLVRGDEERPLTVRLQPCGCVTGRLLDAGGKPRAEAPIYGRSEDKYMSITTLRWWELYVSSHTARDGRFRVDGLIPGTKYSLVIGGKGYAVTVEAGECKNLGDLRFTPAGE